MIGTASTRTAAVIALSIACASPVHAEPPPQEGMERFTLRADAAPAVSASGWLQVGLMAGAAQMDTRLTDYQWDVSPRFGWGVETLAGRGRFGAGLRLWRSGSTQQLGASGAPANASVAVTSLELVAQGRLGWIERNELLVSLSAGRLYLGYDPDRITIQTSGGPVAVDLRPIQEWVGGAGLGLRRILAPGWTAALGFERRLFALDTAHRNGDQIELSRESFGDWSARFGVARHFGR